MLRNTFGLIYAGEQNINLRELVYLRTVGALPVGGRYRAIDFILSNMVNSGIRNIGVIAQRSYHSLMDHLGSGKEWDLSRKNDGLFILPPFSSAENMGTYRGLVDAIKGVMGYISRSKQQYCILSGSYTIFNRTFDDMVECHMDSGADITMLYNEEEADFFRGERYNDVRLHLNEEGRVVDLEINATTSDSKKVGMDTYVMRKDLLEYLVEDCMSRGKYNFVSDLLMGNLNRIKIMGYEHKGYVGRLHSVASYYKINMDFLNRDVQDHLFYSDNQIYTKIKDEVPAKYAKTSNVKNSLVANGCIIEGEVENSILFRGVYVGKGAKIKNSIIMQNSEIYNNSDLEYVILDKSVNIRQGRRLIGDEVFPVIIRKGAIV
ncbi:glucose-1-phosphate adenylyltransferase subunit GlgD [Christensenella tenuis]|uniref:Glucose-1-phosphate adenylyltransferase subunit GlgD n=1 Tax=Christensenella tenuis TaxID=2763033 RepID=A0ABR7EAT1_9FIRM|nr:glucose-1-phosphate adenylyltransferase subunit GlgD [Christensenella tenuis]MBC5646885.1 glucose-1-phosphate adenylyltransferase subunit GlgD [Christensenella tenuis]